VLENGQDRYVAGLCANAHQFDMQSVRPGKEHHVVLTEFQNNRSQILAAVRKIFFLCFQPLAPL